MQISNILFTVLAAGASLVAAEDTVSGTSTSTINLTKTATLTSISHASSAIPTISSAVSSIASNTTTYAPPTTTATFFPAGNATLGVASATGFVRVNSTAKATGLKSSAGATATSSDDTSSASSTSSAAATSSSSAAAAGAQAVRGGLLLGALGAVAMLL